MSGALHVPESRLEQMRQKYYEVRRLVFDRATQPEKPDAWKHEKNRQKFRREVERVCAAADQKLYATVQPLSREWVWNHLWTKIKYAGIRAQAASREIQDIEPLFRDHLVFKGQDWDLVKAWESRLKRFRVLHAGESASDFIARKGAFRGLRTNGKLTKLSMIIDTARRYGQYFDDNPGATALDFVAQGVPLDDVWKIHEGLMSAEYRGDLTCCHLLMDLGFEVIKPDIVVTRLFLLWGWLHDANPELPSDLNELDLVGKGKYGQRYRYFLPEMYRPVIDLARRIVIGLNPAELKKGIGWTTSNPLREFDLFVVKAGQEPDEKYGVERVCYPSERLVSARLKHRRRCC